MKGAHWGMLENVDVWFKAFKTELKILYLHKLIIQFIRKCTSVHSCNSLTSRVAAAQRRWSCRALVNNHTVEGGKKSDLGFDATLVCLTIFWEPLISWDFHQKKKKKEAVIRVYTELCEEEQQHKKPHPTSGSSVGGLLSRTNGQICLSWQKGYSNSHDPSIQTCWAGKARQKARRGAWRAITAERHIQFHKWQPRTGIRGYIRHRITEICSMGVLLLFFTSFLYEFIRRYCCVWSSLEIPQYPGTSNVQNRQRH